MLSIDIDAVKLIHCRLDSYTSQPNHALRTILFNDLEPLVSHATANGRKPILICTLVWERYDLDIMEREIIAPLMHWLNVFAGNLVLLLNSAYDYSRYHVFRSIDPSLIEWIDWSLLRTDKLHKQFQQELSTSWNADASQALLLTGKPHKDNRIGLLGKFYDRESISHLEYSLHVNQGIIDRCRPMFPAWTDARYSDFIRDCARDLDAVDIEMQPDSIHYLGVPYDHKLYENTALSIISESELHDTYSFITEKTYRAMLNCHPFVLAGSAHSLDWLESLGFRTFRLYMVEPDYDALPPYAKLDAIVTNTLAFLSRKKGKDDDILSDTVHNKQQILKVIEDQHAILHSIICSQLENVDSDFIKNLLYAM